MPRGVYVRTEQARANIGAAQRGKLGHPQSEKTRAKIKAHWNARHPCSLETRIAMSVAQRGKVKTPEHRAALSVAHKGKTLSSEHCANISASVKRVGLITHHIDHNRSNNDPGDVLDGKVGNLALMFMREHARWHAWERS